jgi:hypothetical protein
MAFHCACAAFATVIATAAAYVLLRTDKAGGKADAALVAVTTAYVRKSAAVHDAAAFIQGITMMETIRISLCRAEVSARQGVAGPLTQSHPATTPDMALRCMLADRRSHAAGLADMASVASKRRAHLPTTACWRQAQLRSGP